MDRPKYAKAKGRNENIEDIWDLLYWMWRGPYSSGITTPILHKSRNGVCYVERHYDRNYYFSYDSRDVSLEISDYAIKGGMLEGKPEWGYTSNCDFVISDYGISKISNKYFEDMKKIKEKENGIESSIADKSGS